MRRWVAALDLAVGRCRPLRRAAVCATGVIGLAGLLGVTCIPTAAEGAPRADRRKSADNGPTVPSDPNEAPRMAAPNGQPQPDSQRRDVDHTSSRSSRRRFMLTTSPLYASFRLPFIGRAQVPVRGGGFGLTAQIPVWRPFGFRADVAHTVHPVADRFVVDEESEDIDQTAARGNVQATHAGVSATFTMDIGRVIPSLFAGVGALWIRSPPAVVDGQLGGTCRSQGVCDTGLACGADNVCRVGTTPQIHGGAAVDVLVLDHLAIGAQVRYFALLSAPTSYPVFLTAGLRASVRF